MNARAHARPRLRRIDVRLPLLARDDVDWTSALLDRTDRAILRNADGQTTVNALASSLGLSDDAMASALAKLEAHGLLTFAPPPRASGPSCPPVRLQSGMRPAARTLPAIGSSPPPPMSAAEAEMEAAHRRLAGLTHYEILGVPRDADAMDVTLAYLALAATYGGEAAPDGLAPGEHAAREEILARASDAHETLVSSERRAAYDATIARARRTEPGLGTPPSAVSPGSGDPSRS